MSGTTPKSKNETAASTPAAASGAPPKTAPPSGNGPKVNASVPKLKAATAALQAALESKKPCADVKTVGKGVITVVEGNLKAARQQGTVSFTNPDILEIANELEKLLPSIRTTCGNQISPTVKPTSPLPVSSRKNRVSMLSMAAAPSAPTEEILTRDQVSKELKELYKDYQAKGNTTKSFAQTVQDQMKGPLANTLKLYKSESSQEGRPQDLLQIIEEQIREAGILPEEKGAAASASTNAAPVEMPTLGSKWEFTEKGNFLPAHNGGKSSVTYQVEITKIEGDRFTSKILTQKQDGVAKAGEGEKIFTKGEWKEFVDRKKISAGGKRRKTRKQKHTHKRKSKKSKSSRRRRM